MVLDLPDSPSQNNVGKQVSGLPAANRFGLSRSPLTAGGLANSGASETQAAYPRIGYSRPRPRTPARAEIDDQFDRNEQIQERNGIWVVTIGGIWQGDYIKREHAVAAVKAAGYTLHCEHR